MKGSRAKWIAYLGMLSLLASLIVGLMGYSNSTKKIEEIKNLLLSRSIENNIQLTMKYLNQTYGTLTQGKGTLLDQDGNSIEGHFDMVDSVLEDLGDKSTIFVKEKDDFKRISTNIRDDENERAMSTYLGKEHNAYDTVIKGDLYVGEAVILGENYFTAYQPIKDYNHNVIGLLFVGMPTADIDQMILDNEKEMRKIDLWIIIFRAISLGSLIMLVGINVRGNKQMLALKNQRIHDGPKDQPPPRQ